MSTEVDVILSGICTTQKSLRKETFENIRQASSHLKPVMFSSLDRPIYEIIIKYFTSYNGLLDAEVFKYNVNNSNITEERKYEYEVRFNEVLNRNVRRDKFISCLHVFISSYKKSKYAEVINQAVSELDGSDEGFDKSRKVLDDGLTNLEGGINSGDSSSDLKEGFKEFMASFKKRKRDPEGASNYIPFGFTAIDDVLGGINYKNLVFLSGATNHFKSTVARHIAYTNFINGKNIVIGQGEVTEEEFKTSLISLHSTHPKFNLGFGITKDMIKFPHKYKEQQDLEENLLKVTEDFSTNIEHGYFYQFNFPMNCTVAELSRKVQIYQSMFNVDLLIVDELRHLSSDRKRNQHREEYGDVVLNLDKFIKTFNGGKGLRCICLHKVNRKFQEFALEHGYYPLQSLAESDETEKAANVSIWVLQSPQMEEDSELKIGVNKARDARKNFDFMCFVNGDTGLIGEKQR